jgi:hypothetical protein
VEVEEVVMGKGKVGEGGYDQIGGPGVRLWCMIWRKGGGEGSGGGVGDEVVRIREEGMDEE